MTARFRRRTAAALRLLALALFALALVLRPVVDSLGEMHEFAHGGHGRVQHVAGAPAAAPALRASTQEGERASTMHALLNFVHCCGATMAALPEVAVVPLASPAASAPLSPALASPARGRLIHPFRPPIES